MLSKIRNKSVSVTAENVKDYSGAKDNLLLNTKQHKPSNQMTMESETE